MSAVRFDLWLLGGLALVAIAGCGGHASRPPIPAGLERPAPGPTTAVSLQTPQAAPPVILAPIEVVRPASEWSRAEAAADSLKRMGPAAVPPLVAMLADQDPVVRTKAVQILASIGPDAQAAVPQLRQSLHDPDPQVQRWAARALGQIGPAASAAVPDLIDALRGK